MRGEIFIPIRVEIAKNCGSARGGWKTAIAIEIETDVPDRSIAGAKISRTCTSSCSAGRGERRIVRRPLFSIPIVSSRSPVDVSAWLRPITLEGSDRYGGGALGFPYNYPSVEFFAIHFSRRDFRTAGDPLRGGRTSSLRGHCGTKEGRKARLSARPAINECASTIVRSVRLGTCPDNENRYGERALYSRSRR